MSLDPRHYDVILSPVITEKATARSEHNQVVFRVRKDANDNSALFKADATFCAQQGSGGVRLTAWNFPGQYLRHYNAELWLATPGGPAAYDGAGLFVEDTTWSVDAPWAP